MNSFKVGSHYLLLGIPLWIGGVVESEDLRFVWLTAKSAEYLPDAERLEDYINRKAKGEMIGRRTAVHKDSLNTVIEI